jgi:hypothetical protein
VRCGVRRTSDRTHTARQQWTYERDGCRHCPNHAAQRPLRAHDPPPCSRRPGPRSGYTRTSPITRLGAAGRGGRFGRRISALPRLSVRPRRRGSRWRTRSPSACCGAPALSSRRTPRRGENARPRRRRACYPLVALAIRPLASISRSLGQWHGEAPGGRRWTGRSTRWSSTNQAPYWGRYTSRSVSPSP